MLRRTAVRLLGLADLAERAAGRSLPIRWLALWFLQYADEAARDYVARSVCNLAGRRWSPALASVRYGYGSADAIDLAASLRALAAIVRDMAACIRPSPFLQPGRVSAAVDPNDEALLRLLGSAFLPAERLDTS